MVTVWEPVASGKKQYRRTTGPFFAGEESIERVPKHRANENDIFHKENDIHRNEKQLLLRENESFYMVEESSSKNG